MATSDLTPKDTVRGAGTDPATGEYRVIGQGQTFRSITEKIAGIVLTPTTPLGWFAVFGVGGAGATMLLVAVTWLFLKGTGIWAVTQPVAWGFAIINFVWWIGIGHAGTLISAILLLFKQGWRNSINRFAEAMTIFAVVCAGMFPLIHVGRPWLGYWLLPIPLTMDVWPQFRSPLLWDVFAVSTYATISVVFWYIGMVPDFGTMRDRAQSKIAFRDAPKTLRILTVACDVVRIEREDRIVRSMIANPQKRAAPRIFGRRPRKLEVCRRRISAALREKHHSAQH
jgi:molybdopterin-containing oxidoreductase family membrane subunit